MMTPAETLEALDLLTTASYSDAPGIIADADLWEALRSITWGLVRPISRGAATRYWSAACNLAVEPMATGIRRAEMPLAPMN